MHKGRSYPYHWYYWATESLFWPGFAPWELMLVGATGNPPPWAYIDGYPMTLSKPADGVSDWTQIWWDFRFSVLIGAVWMRITIEQETIGTDWLVWKAELRTDYIPLPLAEVYYFQNAPCLFTRPSGRWWTAHDPATAQDGPIINVRYATWGEIDVQPHA